MTKLQILTSFLELTTQMHIIALELIEKKKYASVDLFFNDVMDTLLDDSVMPEAEKVAIYGNVDVMKTMQEIGENQALMIFGEEKKNE